MAVSVAPLLGTSAKLFSVFSLLWSVYRVMAGPLFAGSSHARDIESMDAPVVRSVGALGISSTSVMVMVALMVGFAAVPVVCDDGEEHFGLVLVVELGNG